MRYDSAHRKAWALAGILITCAVAARWVSEGLDVGWVVHMALIVAAAVLVAVGFGLRQRAMDEPVMGRILSARLNRETSDLTE